jgi:LmbE family N-acetylglucosaminyl deacetylase
MIQNESDLYPYSVSDFSSNDALVIAPHPDDESIGCGGSIIRHISAGSRVKIVFLTDGEKGDFESRCGQDYRTLRKRSSHKALEILGVGDCEFWGYPDRTLCLSENELGERLIHTVETFSPSLIYVPSPFEAHPDHRASFNAVWKIREKLDIPILLYEILMALYPDTLVDISREMEPKKRAIRSYHTELSYNDYLSKVEGLNRFRTGTLPKDIEYAEAFILWGGKEHLTETLPLKLVTSIWKDTPKRT